ncbi:MAG: hypothetical protein IH914_04715 [candidate division Zixibacteria bacterium]|nr:hypothetical protein [candidate division Zixibacteria bacterium]
MNKPLVRKRKQKKTQLSVLLILSRFKQNMESLRLFVENIAPHAAKQDELTSDRLTRLMSRAFKKPELVKLLKTAKKNGGKSSSDIKQRAIEVLTRELEPIRRIGSPKETLLYRSAFVLLVSYVEILMSELFKFHLLNHPSVLANRTSASIHLEKLLSCSGLDDAINQIIKAQVDKMLYSSFEDKVDVFSKELGVNDFNEHVDLVKLIEVMERRNLIVHNDLRVNSKYINKVPVYLRRRGKKAIKVGERLTITKSYFRESFDECHSFGLILLHDCWRKWSKDEVSVADKTIVQDTFELLEDDRWWVAQRVSAFGLRLDPKAELQRFSLHVNYCQSLKWQGDVAKLKKELETIDRSALQPLFALAVCALESDKDNFFRLLGKAARLNEIEKDDLMTWPLFREFREDPKFSRRVGYIFGAAKRVPSNKITAK